MLSKSDSFRGLSLSWRSTPVVSWKTLARQGVTRRRDAGWSVATEQKYPVLLEYAKASFERIKQRLRHHWALVRVKRVLNDCTLASDLDRQFGWSDSHWLLADPWLHANDLLSARSPTLDLKCQSRPGRDTRLAWLVAWDKIGASRDLGLSGFSLCYALEAPARPGLSLSLCEYELRQEPALMRINVWIVVIVLIALFQ